MNKRELPSFVNKEDLKKLILKILNLAKESLIERDKGEEIYLEPLFKRARYLISPSDFVIKEIENSNLQKVIKNFSDFNNKNPLELN